MIQFFTHFYLVTNFRIIAFFYCILLLVTYLNGFSKEKLLVIRVYGERMFFFWFILCVNNGSQSAKHFFNLKFINFYLYYLNYIN